MLHPKSLRARFAFQLALAGAMLILIFSVVLYQYIKISIFENIIVSLKNEAIQISALNNLKTNDTFMRGQISVKITKNINESKPRFEENKKEQFITLFYPLGELCLELKKDSTEYNEIISQILSNILFLNASAIFLILFYALFLSRMLLMPIRSLSLKLSRLNENFLKNVEPSSVPSEFKPLVNSINMLIQRIATFAKYQKELFIGAAHELKTPLAVMKTKAEVTLLKERDKQAYIEVIKQNIQSIDKMNKMISSILEIGRQEGAQFEKPTRTDIIALLGEICDGFKALASAQGLNLITKFSPNTLKINIQSTLFTHIVQNFIQNALKFSPDSGSVVVRCALRPNNELEICVIDEGCGVDESKDLFAPFKRYGDKGGSGLGLFLAKNAAAALGAQISVENRKDGKNGTIACLKIFF